MTTKLISAWTASASLTSDEGTIAFQFADGTSTPPSNPIPSARLTAIIAVLESSQAAWLHTGPGETFHVSNSPNAPGQ